MNRKFLLPVVIFAAIAVAFAVGLTLDSKRLPSALIDKPAPRFDLPPIAAVNNGEPYGSGFSSRDLIGRVTLVNVFASWCGPCRVEHPQLMSLSRDHGVPIFGINQKDKPEDAQAWLERHGDPYLAIGADTLGRISIDWGVYGVPETFVVDTAGRIRYRHVGPIMPRDITRTILPMVAELMP
ncbi:MAG: DsbE family thiol:disulfide interchange protein [Alphaproteobacteria bacterium]|nr:DsbE family thiol:disulfide interchange protein [Alphaproteobacteria bacterium]